MNPKCQCQYEGPLLSQGHRNHHKEWEQILAVPPTTSTTTAIEVTHLIIAIDSIIAALHGAPLPTLTPGAAAIIANHRSNQ